MNRSTDCTSPRAAAVIATAPSVHGTMYSRAARTRMPQGCHSIEEVIRDARGQ